MNKVDKFIAIIEEFTPLKKDVDLFYLEMPIDKSGLWFSDTQTDSRFNDSGAKQFDIYYRGKDKTNTLANVTYFKDTIDSMDECRLTDGEDFLLRVLYEWDYIGKDSEGYFVFSNVVRVI